MTQSRDTVGSSHHLDLRDALEPSARSAPTTRVSFEWLVESFDALGLNDTSALDLQGYLSRSGYCSDDGSTNAHDGDDDGGGEDAGGFSVSMVSDSDRNIESTAMQSKFRSRPSAQPADTAETRSGVSQGDPADHKERSSPSGSHRAAASKRAVALALTPINAIKDAFMRHRESLSHTSKHYTIQQMDILRSICNMVIKICTLYRIDPLSKVLRRHQQFIGDASKFLKASQQEFAGKAEVCSITEERYYNLVYTYQSVALLPILDRKRK